MSNDIEYVIFKNHMIKTNNIKQLATQFCDIAIDIRLGFNIKIQGKETFIESEEMNRENKEITITIDCWDFKFERREEKNEYHLTEIERNNDTCWDFKWWHIAVLNTIILRANGEILWVAIDEGCYSYMYKIEKGLLEVKEFPFWEVLKEGIIWGDKFKDVKHVEQHLYQ